MSSSDPRLPNVLQDAINNAVDVQMVGVDRDRVWRRTQRRHRALRVDAVARLDLFAHCLLVHALTASFELRGSAPYLLVQAGGEKELVLCIRKDDGADVAPRHDNS